MRTSNFKNICDAFDELFSHIQVTEPKPPYDSIKAKIEEIKESFEPAWLDEAKHILCGDNDEAVILQVELIVEAIALDNDIEYNRLESITDVLVWKPLVGRYTCGEFLAEIGY